MSLELMKKRMDYDGGNTSDGRYVRGKYLSFKSALESYQGEWITFNDKIYRCLINPDKLTTDYDQKEISIDFAAGMKDGDTFLWNRTGTHWICYLQRYEEEAYYRAQIRQCDFEIEVNGKSYWIYTRGPVETALIWKQKHNVEINELNYSIMFYITKDENTNEFFKRLRKVKFDGHTWQVAAVDRYSQPNLIEVYLDEYFDNEMEDAAVDDEVITPDPAQPYIDGPQFVRPYDTNLSFSVVGLTTGTFVVNSNKVKIVDSTDTSCVIDILTGRAGEFVLSYMIGGVEAAALKVTIKSL